MLKITIKEVLKKWKIGNYFRELSVVIVGVFVTLAGTDLVSRLSQERQIKETMRMIRLELEENKQSIAKAELAYLDEVAFFRLLRKNKDSLRIIPDDVLEEKFNYPFCMRNLDYSEDALDVLKSSALMQQITDKQFILKLLQAYKLCRRVKNDNDIYYEYKGKATDRLMSESGYNYGGEGAYTGTVCEMWKMRLQIPQIKYIVWNLPNTFDENPFTASQSAITEMIRLIEERY